MSNISDKVFLGKTVSPFENAGEYDAIDRVASNYNDTKEKVQKIRELICTENYDADIAKYITGVPEMKFQRMLKDARIWMNWTFKHYQLTIIM